MHDQILASLLKMLYLCIQLLVYLRKQVILDSAAREGRAFCLFNNKHVCISVCC